MLHCSNNVSIIAFWSLLRKLLVKSLGNCSSHIWEKSVRSTILFQIFSVCKSGHLELLGIGVISGIFNILSAKVVAQ